MKSIEVMRYHGENQKTLFLEARNIRKINLGDLCEIRSVFEFTNECRQICHYCGMAATSSIKRFRHSMDTIENILAGFKKRASIMLQGGESDSDIFKLCKVIEKFSHLNITASFGNLSYESYQALRNAGVRRYILKFETSNEKLHRKIRPGDTLKNRLKKIDELMSLGFEVSTGNITGLPGQTLQMLDEDISLMKSIGCKLLSTSPFIPNDSSKLSSSSSCNLDLVLNFMALMRINIPNAIIPTVSALEILKKGGQLEGLNAGANALALHDASCTNYSKYYHIYSNTRYEPRAEALQIINDAGLSPHYEAII